MRTVSLCLVGKEQPAGYSAGKVVKHCRIPYNNILIVKLRFKSTLC